jgi:tetratricopeptide (TPR) repeat protein
MRPTPRLVRASRWCRRNPAVAALALALASSLVALALVQTSRLRAEQARRDRAERELAEQEQDLGAFTRLLVSHHRLASAAVFGIGSADAPSVLADVAPLRARLRLKRRDGTIDLADLAVLGQLESYTCQRLVVEGRSLPEAEDAMHEAVSALEEVVVRAPGLALSRQHLVEALCVGAWIDAELGKPDRALDAFVRAREVALAGSDSGIDPFLVQTISAHRLAVAGRLRSRGEDEPADRCLRANLELIEGEDARGIDEPWLPVHRAITRFGLGETPVEPAPSHIPDFASTLLRDAWTNLLNGRLSDLLAGPADAGAIDDFIAEIESHEAMLGLEAGSSLPNLLGHVAFQIASAERSPAELSASLPEAWRLLDFIRCIADRQPDPLAFVEPLHSAFGFLGTVLRASGDLDGAERLAEAFLRLARDLSERHPDRAEAAQLLASAYEQMAKNAWQYDDIPGVATWTRRSIEAMRRAVELDPSNELYRNWLLERERRLAALPPH